MESITINLFRDSMTMAEAVELFGVTPLVLLISGLVLAVIGITLAVFFGMWIYNDAKERSDNPILWTLIVLFVPMLIGLIVYLLVGRNKTAESTNRYLKSFITTAVFFMVNLSVVIGSAVHLMVLLADHGMIDPISIWIG